MKYNFSDYKPARLRSFMNSLINNKFDLEYDEAKHALLLMSLNPIDFKIAESLCEKYLINEDDSLHYLSLLCIGHIARVYEKLVKKELYNKIIEIYFGDNEKLSHGAESALDDIQMFLKIKKPVR